MGGWVDRLTPTVMSVPEKWSHKHRIRLTGPLPQIRFSLQLSHFQSDNGGMFQPVSIGFPVLPASSVLTGGCVITSDAGTAGGGGEPVWRFQSAGLTDVGRMRIENG